jgi:hypothetical protein
MQVDDLTRERAAALKNKLRPMLAYLGKLKRRMVQRGFLNEDPLQRNQQNASQSPKHRPRDSQLAESHCCTGKLSGGKIIFRC